MTIGGFQVRYDLNDFECCVIESLLPNRPARPGARR